MSLLMDALKRAEQAKQRGPRETATPELAMEATRPADAGAAKSEALPTLPRLEDLDEEFIGQTDKPAWQTKSAATERASVRNAFAAKTTSSSGQRNLMIAAALGLLAIGGIAFYVWLQIKPTQSLVATKQPAGVGMPEMRIAPTRPAGSEVLPAPSVVEQALPEDAEEDEVQAVRPPEASPRPARRPPPPARPDEPIRVAASRPGIDPSVAEGYRLLQAGNLPAARAAYLRALQSDPRNTDALHGIAAISLREGKKNDAETAYQRILEANPADPAALAGLVGLNGRIDPVSGESRMKSVLAAQGDVPVANFALGNLYSRQQRWNEAQQAYFKAVTGDAGNPDYLFNLAVSLDQLHQPKLAAQYYDQALTAAKTRAAAFDRTLAAQRLRELQP